MKTVVIAGDLIRDFNLVQHPLGPQRHHEQLPRTVLKVQEGGAWYLRDMIELACSDLTGKSAPTFLEPPRPPQGKPANDLCIHLAHQVWSLHDKSLKDKKDKKEKVWRIENFLGCQEPEPGAKPLKPPAARRADLLVLDDIGCGFAEKPGLWPAALAAVGETGEIILKTSSPPGVTALWRELVRRRMLDRLTVILSAKLLRERGSEISQGLSWDRTIEDVVKEFEDGRSSQDLARCKRVIVQFGCSGAAVFTRLRPPYEEDQKPPLLERARFERFIYHPEETEGAWQAIHPGLTFGTTSLLTASVVRHVLRPADYPLFIAVGRGLAAARLNHELGGGEDKKPGAGKGGAQGSFNPRAPVDGIRGIFRFKPEPGKSGKDPAFDFSSAFPHDLLDNEEMQSQPARESDLLRDFTGCGLEYVAAKAFEVVFYGVDRALTGVPKVRYGKYITADRDEIERINAIRSLVLAYRDNKEDKRPLSIAVFGPPGSGKSFAIEQLSSELLPGAEVMKFNLSQFHQDHRELHRAFHQVHDASVQGQTPLVFWDEFDSDNFFWLKCFLEPMQDKQFRDDGIQHPFGKTIFVFAGGTCCDFDTFDRTNAEEETAQKFRDCKGPDFISRLRGFVNIKGTNPTGQCALGGASGPPRPYEELAEEDVAHLIRRAIILRVGIERHFNQIIDESSHLASIDAGVVGGFLRVREFRHGARSVDALVSMSSVGTGRHFGVADLPSRELLRLHVTDDFLEHVETGELEVPVTEALAEACHEAWYKERKRAGWKYGPVRNDRKKLHPRLLHYAKLWEAAREDNRKSARVVRAKLNEIGRRIERATAGSRRTMLDAKEKKQLMKIEHDIWLRDRLLSGFEWAASGRDELRLNPDIVPFDLVPPKDQKLDRAIVESISPTLRKHGYTLV